MCRPILNSQPTKREAFTAIPQRRHSRIPSRSSRKSLDLDTLSTDDVPLHKIASLALPTTDLATKHKSNDTSVPARKRSNTMGTKTSASDASDVV